MPTASDMGSPTPTPRAGRTKGKQLQQIPSQGQQTPAQGQQALSSEANSPTPSSTPQAPSHMLQQCQTPPPPISWCPTDPSILQHHLHSGQISLIDLTWSLYFPTPSIASTHLTFPFRTVHNGIAHDNSVPISVLASTPSDFATLVLSPDFCSKLKSDERGLVLMSLRAFGLEREEEVKTILDYLYSGRFNSAAHNGGVYSVERWISLLGVAGRYGMSRITELVLVEMQREFGNRTHMSIPIDLAMQQLDRLSRIYNTRVQEFLVGYVEHLFRTPKGVREPAKKAVEQCVLEQGALSEGGSILYRIVQKWFRENPNPSRGKRDGELTRLRNIKASTGGVKRGRCGSVSVTPVSINGSQAEGMGTPTPSQERTKRGRFTGGGEVRTPSRRMDVSMQGSRNGSPLKNEVELMDVEMSDVDVENVKRKDCGNDQDTNNSDSDSNDEWTDKDGGDFGWAEDLERQSKEREMMPDVIKSSLPL